ncbi:hypothetical protein N0V93_008080 [Gnomoniopsis smithogilvyi]|uniref:Nephrocystin 3-like N-terminal domain-containing protein n=1 Tax=Gnomoniopsis smithogilvyi TaxID=1191159 RepID=A0A9W8YNG3_9PEZI|nr:hypothetical protein N0V93_008080 [Gnomoniopsis smithogilvyi]
MFSEAGSCFDPEEVIETQPLPETSAPTTQPEAVKFLDNNLADLHVALKDPVSRYDCHLRRYVAVSEAIIPQESPKTVDSSAQPNMLDGIDGALTSIAQPMKYWDLIFQKSVDRFQTLFCTPKDREKSGWNYSVRDKSNWDGVYAQLQKAREYYDGDTKGLWGRRAKDYTKKRRWVVDHSVPVARQAVKFVPQMDYATPVIAAVQVLVDAFETTSHVRETMTAGLDKDDLESKFSNIERFLATFPQDGAIEEASVELVVATLKAIEDAIGFFLESNVKKAFSATLRGKEYQKKPLASLEQIRVRGDKLLQAAQKSHITDTQQKLDMVLNGMAVSFIEQRQTGTNVRDMTKKVTSVLEKLDKREASDAFLRNKLLDLLNEAQEGKERELEEKRRLKDLEDNVLRLLERVEELTEQARSPSPGLLPQPPSPHGFAPAVTPTTLSVPEYMPQFLLPYVPQNTTISPTYALDCTAWGHAPSQAQHEQTSSSTLSRSETLNTSQIRTMLLRFDHVDTVDTDAILEDEGRSINFRERRKADLIVSTSQFHDWMVSSESSELLVHGDFRGPRSFSAGISALSVFCATLTQTLRAQGPQHIVLVFYCGCHVERDDQHRGATGMMRSFNAQLVRSTIFDAVTQETILPQLDGQSHLEATLQSGRLSHLCQLFRSLVRLLPDQVTLICLIDGISHYETDEFEDGLSSSIDFLLDLVRSENIATCIKLLATSPTMTDLAQHKFKNDGKSFVSLAEIRDLGQGLGIRDISNDAINLSSSDISDDSDEDKL